MDVNAQEWSKAPAGTYNPFANDAQCVAVHYVTGKDFADVIDACLLLMAGDQTLSDYDVFEDTTVDKIVGVTCRDV